MYLCTSIGQQCNFCLFIIFSIFQKQLGYVDGGGLGKSGQGRAEPISASTQHGRRGLGFIPSSQGKPYDGSEWDPREEIINLHDKPVIS